MGRSRVVLDRRAFGEQVMQSAALEEQLRPYAEAAAARVPDATIRAVRTGVGTANARVRLRVEGKAWQRERLVAAIRAVLNKATER